MFIKEILSLKVVSRQDLLTSHSCSWDDSSVSCGSLRARLTFVALLKAAACSVSVWTSLTYYHHAEDDNSCLPATHAPEMEVQSVAAP